MPIIVETAAKDHLCPFRAFEPCVGKLCMAWAWNGQRMERLSTDNLMETPDGPRPTDMLPRRPDGDGWETDGEPYLIGYANSAKLKLPKATTQRWVRHLPKVRGHCSRCNGPESYYDDEIPL